MSSIMIYGDYGQLPANILEHICKKGIPIIIHRRNVAKPIYICSPLRADIQDTISKQMIFRANGHKVRHIARQIIKAKFKAMKWLIPNYELPTKEMTLKEIRQLEALHAKRYWSEYYKKLGFKKSKRRENGMIASSLNALSKFLSGIVLRWITYHHLSPFHGFLHVTTDYPALVYDLMEPYRGHFELIAFKQFKTVKDPDQNKGVVGMVINAAKEGLNENIYTGLTRQIVTRHELYHGIVLSLKNYLLGNQRSFMIPTVDQPNGGRPKKVCFRLYGRQAGKTDFWQKAREAADAENKRNSLSE
ncbi:MAG: hypothetical protein D6808_00090 [Candidatus Dadabacteria bacterium]|nr:MAG: hypothetical protein D6808_00090 [Candidatus Dadabacteria bacterium]